MLIALFVLNLVLIGLLMRSEYRLQKLEARVIRLARKVKSFQLMDSAPSPPGGEGFLSGWGVLSVITLFAFGFLVLSCIVVVLAFGSSSADDAFDFAAYVTPGFAAICGGFGLYNKKDEKRFFTAAGVLVLAGLIFYLASRMEKLPHIFQKTDGLASVLWLSCGFLLLLIGILLVLVNTKNTGALSQLRGKPRCERIMCWIFLAASALMFLGYAYLAWDRLAPLLLLQKGNNEQH